jgi:transposase
MTNINKQDKKQRKKYSSQFKEQAVERAKRDGVPKAAKDLDIHTPMLYAWVRKHNQTGIPFEEKKLQEAELARLRRECARLTTEVEFLKKAAAYFAKEPK